MDTHIEQVFDSLFVNNVVELVRSGITVARQVCCNQVINRLVNGKRRDLPGPRRLNRCSGIAAAIGAGVQRERRCRMRGRGWEGHVWQSKGSSPDLSVGVERCNVGGGKNDVDLYTRTELVCNRSRCKVSATE